MGKEGCPLLGQLSGIPKGGLGLTGWQMAYPLPKTEEILSKSCLFKNLFSLFYLQFKKIIKAKIFTLSWVHHWVSWLMILKFLKFQLKFRFRWFSKQIFMKTEKRHLPALTSTTTLKSSLYQDNPRSVPRNWMDKSEPKT